MAARHVGCMLENPALIIQIESKHFFFSLTLSRREIVYSLEQVQLNPSELFPRCPLDEKMKLKCNETNLVFRSVKSVFGQ